MISLKINGNARNCKMFKIVFLFSLLAKFALGAEPNLLIKVKSAEMIYNENPIMGKWSAVINPGEKENSVDINLEMKDVVPQDAMCFIDLDKGDGKKKTLKMRLCDAIHEVILGNDLFSRLSPKDKAPKDCPFQPGSLFIKNYAPNKGLIPPGMMKDGIFKFSARFTDANENPWIIGNFELEISHGPLTPQMG
ncbi:uncharacterized protein LOC117170670 [Belonocnema kinseyi]|uniref:uncharacterized protein LOC117170670 n=1 Tax=Belonocnema kinseyi TaxID=2817044 RepID=UPI00143D89FA|nr:uncharacterized protein LOC117170670 [Belonocnema kinseyi]